MQIEEKKIRDIRRKEGQRLRARESRERESVCVCVCVKKKESKSQIERVGGGREGGWEVTFYGACYGQK